MTIEEKHLSEWINDPKNETNKTSESFEYTEEEVINILETFKEKLKK